MSRLSLDILIVHCLFLSSLSLNSLPAIKQPTNQPKKKKKKIPKKKKSQENTHEVVFMVLGGIHWKLFLKL